MPNDQAQLDRAAQRRSQLEGLNTLLHTLVPANIFYQKKLNAAGCVGPVSSLEQYAERFPFTLKQELVDDQAAHPPFGTNLTFPLERYVRFHQTSGTSGNPLRWLDTAESWDGMLRLWEQVFLAFGVEPRDRVFCAFSFGPFIGFWLAFEAARRLGCLSIPGGGLSSSARLRLILDAGVTVLCCTPTYAIRLGEVAARENLDLAQSKIRAILVAGEPGGSVPAIRARIEQRWPGARVLDHHGMTEVGPVSCPCPERHDILHVMESGYFPEIIDPLTGHPVPNGELGELVLTTLIRTGSPVLRYRTGDMVRASREARCRCGRLDLALEGGIVSRADSMVVVRGVNVYPGAVDALVQSCGGIAEYQVRVSEVESMTELQLVIEPETSGKDEAALAGKLANAFQTTMSLRVRVSVVPQGSLPRFEMKAQRWVRDH